MYTASFEARIEFNRQIGAVEKAPLDDRREAGKEWAQALKDTPEIVIERIEWLLEGNYGWGSYEVARETVTHKRMNRAAWLGVTIAALEWQCPNDRARAGWNKLDKAAQNAITDKINAAIAQYLQDNEL